MHHTRSTAIYPIDTKLLPLWAGAKHIIAIERTGSRWQGKKSRRRESSRGPLVKVNCAALPEHLLEAELFGHEKGAFTGANNLRIGRFEQANGGTIFLDEVGELRPTIQGKLLRVLQDKSFAQSGGREALLEDVLPDWYHPPPQGLSLQEHLSGQISVLSLPQKQNDALIYLTQWLSPSGYLEGSAESWARGTVWSPREVKAVVPAIPSLDPPGIGARSLRECLLLQLKYQLKTLAFLLVQYYL
jgi:hypothetical protein